MTKDRYREDPENSFYAKHLSARYRKNSFHNDRAISTKNKKAVDDFIYHWVARKNIKEKRVAKYYANFRMLLKVAGKKFDLDKATEKDIERLVYKINNSKYAEWTKSDLRGVLKRYYTFKNEGITPSKVKWITTARPKPKHKTAEELISREELTKLIDACQNERDRAFLMVLYEGGLRAGEMSALKISSVIFSDTGMWLDIPEVPGVTKTGGRKIPLIESEPYLKNWINVHPDRKNKNSPLWVKLEQYVGGVKPMTYDNMRMMIFKKAKSAGVDTDKVNLHNFRHSSASEKAAAGWSKAQMDKYFGWDPNSNTASVYIHMQPHDLLSAVRKLHGLPTSDIEKVKAKIQCQRCGRLNDSDARFCSGCQVPLNIETALEVEKERNRYDEIMTRFMEKMRDNPVMREILDETIREIGGG
ncbi:MAG TPA: hypothetical protein ENG66_08430 [Thermococcus sp.]|nr:hypothetical protein [Thermococcus sp.]